MQRRIKYIVLVFIMLISCKSKKSQVEIFYYNYDFNAPKSVLCDGFYAYGNLKRINTLTKKEMQQLEGFVFNLTDSKKSFDIDTRRQLFFKGKTICFDRFKRAICNGVFKDSISSVKLYDFISILIKKYNSKAKTYNVEKIEF